MTSYRFLPHGRPDQGTRFVGFLFLVASLAGSVFMMGYAMMGFEDLTEINKVWSGTDGAGILWKLSGITALTGTMGGALYAVSQMCFRFQSVPGQFAFFLAMTLLLAIVSVGMFFATETVNFYPIALWAQPIALHVVGMIAGYWFIRT